MIRIYADSTNDLPQELLQRYHIRIVPLFVNMGEKTYTDWVDITPDEIYAWSDAHKTTPQSAVFSIGDAVDALTEAKAAGEDVLFFGISSELSASCSVFRLAAEEIGYADHVSVVDSRNLCTGIGLLILKAAARIEAGETDLAAVTSYVESFVPRVRTSSVIETLLYIHRGGRCSAAKALLAGALRIKPKIVVADGRLTVGKKYRGPQSDVIRKYTDDLMPDLAKADPDAVFVSHTGRLDQSIIDETAERVRALGRFHSVYVTRAGSVVTIHCGPGTLGIFYVAGGETGE
ncbi:MAG: DegV family protein [Oscillospiraceae bacterium]|nr:DegV family protein [Oscillospiraceae bacterium]